uniref:CCHC-type domain-containing protein n=1 Tax=Oreochromis aureus TaxID=47969 RepID=A0A668RH43_OREAU
MWFTQGEAQPLHCGCADPCEFPKCGNLNCIICGSGDCVRALPHSCVQNKDPCVCSSLRLAFELGQNAMACSPSLDSGIMRVRHHQPECCMWKGDPCLPHCQLILTWQGRYHDHEGGSSNGDGSMAGSRRNAVRFELQEVCEMDRLQFSRTVIQKELGFSPNQLDYIFGLPGRRIYEVIFATKTLYESCINIFNRKRQSSPQLAHIKMTPLSGREPKAVTVIMHSEYVRVEDIKTWLSFKCSYVRVEDIKTWLSFKCSVIRGLDLKDEDGIRTGAYRFYVHLKRDENSGELTHLPPIIQLGAIRGYVFYWGQPKTCRKCGSNDHLAMECVNVVCRNCKSGEHVIKDCPYPKNCNLCGKEDHTFRSCPQSYANTGSAELLGKLYF